MWPASTEGDATPRITRGPPHRLLLLRSCSSLTLTSCLLEETRRASHLTNQWFPMAHRSSSSAPSAPSAAISPVAIDCRIKTENGRRRWSSGQHQKISKETTATNNLKQQQQNNTQLNTMKTNSKPYYILNLLNCCFLTANAIISALTGFTCSPPPRDATLGYAVTLA